MCSPSAHAEGAAPEDVVGNEADCVVVHSDAAVTAVFNDVVRDDVLAA